MPSQFGSGSAIHAYFQEWVECGVFEELWRLALEEYDELRGSTGSGRAWTGR